MKARVFTHNQMPHSTLTGGGKNWVEDLTVERLAYLAGIPNCIVQVQATPILDDINAQIELWVTLYGADFDMADQLKDGGEVKEM